MCVHGCPRVPDHGGVRFCLHCADFINIENFPSGTRRYLCKQHMWKAIGQHAKAKMLTNPRKRALNKVWGRAYDDSRKFKQLRIDLKQAEIDRLFTANVVDEVTENVSLYEKLANENAVVPVDPTKVLCKSNSAIVACRTRKLLIKQWKLFGKDEYCRLFKKEQTYSSMHPIEDLSESPGLPADNYTIHLTEPHIEML